MTERGASAKGAAAIAAAPATTSTDRAALAALIEFAAEQRIIGAVKAHESFEGILTEHALALEEVYDELHEKLGAALGWPGVADPLAQLWNQIQYVRALGAAGDTEGEEDADNHA